MGRNLRLASWSLWPHKSSHRQHLIFILDDPVLQLEVRAFKLGRHLEPRRHQKAEEPLTFIFRQAYALVAVDEVPTGGSVQAGRRQTLVVFLLAVQAVVT